ncbi:MAG: DUF2807 domain-containing protein [Hyphomonadaceae bacterium]|nr:DUF2807 domain-containing protein [Hyphomonadaceae bacterium]
MRIVLITSAALAALTMSASADTRDISGFTGVGVSDHIAVEIATGPAYTVEVTGSDAARVRTRVEHGSLQISDARRPWFGQAPRLDATVRITMPRVERLAAARGAEVAARDVNADELSIAAAMGGQLEVSGTCSALSAAAAMGGVIDAGELHCATAEVSAAMGGAAEIYASQSYEASAVMGGAIDIAGEAQRGEVSTVMGGAVQHH